MPKGICKNILQSILLLLFIGAGLPKMYAGSVLLSKRISIHVQKQTLESVLHVIEKKATVQFMYNPQMFNVKRVLSLNLEGVTLQEVLQNTINNKDLVFYEMGNYIVITNKRDAPKQANVITAIPQPQTENEITHKIVVDTIHTFDTITISKTDTNHVVIQDTVKVFDTITKTITREMNPLDEPTMQTKPQWFAEASVAPLYTDLLPQSNWLSDMSMQARGMVGFKINNLHVSVGIGTLWQRGSSRSSTSSQTTDSVLQRDTIHVMQKYKVGDYYYISGGETISKPIYDSTLVAVPRQWYSKTTHTNTTQTTVGYSILWVTIPIKIEYEWALSKKASFKMGVCITPAFAVKSEGEIYLSKLGACVPISQSGLQSFTLLTALEPTFSYALTSKLHVLCTPIMQASIRSLLHESAYLFSGGVNFGLRQYF